MRASMVAMNFRVNNKSLEMGLHFTEQKANTTAKADFRRRMRPRDAEPDRRRVSSALPSSGRHSLRPGNVIDTGEPSHALKFGLQL